MTTLADILWTLSDLVNIAIPIVVSLALLAFFWGLAMFIFQSGDTEKRKNGLQIMIWGIIVLFVIVSLWGIINVLQYTFNVEGGYVEVPFFDATGGQDPRPPR